MEATAASLSYKDVKAARDALVEPLVPSNAVCAVVSDAETAPQRLSEEWAELAPFASEPNSFWERWFAGAALRHLEVPAGLKMVEVWTGPNLLGLLPVHLSRGYARLPVLHVANWHHSHCFLGTPLVRVGQERVFWKAVLELLDGEPWSKGFLHIAGLVENGPVHRGLVDASRELGRPCDIVHRCRRALLQTGLAPEAYFEQTVRKKKRKELKRLSCRLAELGKVEARNLSSADELEQWCDAFLDLERSGWKGDRGSALGCDAGTAEFFREAIGGAFFAGKLNFLRLDLDGLPVAMLVNFFAPPGSFSFKIAIDENYARFSPGVLIQIENLKFLERGDIRWMDSCAAQDHPMINSLWAERRDLVRVTVPLEGARRQLSFRICRFAERASAAVRSLPDARKETQVSNDE